MAKSKNKNTMDSISLPDKDKINSMGSGFSASRKVHKETGFDDFTNVVRADFDRARVVKLPGEKTSKDEEEVEEDDFIPKPDPNRKASAVGIKVGKTYIAKRRLAKIIVICVIVLALLVFFFPPIASNDDTVSKSEDVNIFENMSLAELKENIYKNYNVYSEEGLTSEMGENYRLVTVGMKLTNPTPFELKIPGYSIVTADSIYQDKFIYAAPEKTDGDVIDPFSTTTVKIKILVNVANMGSQDFDTAVTSLVLKTTGMKKKIGKSTYCPCIPAVLFVSNAITFDVQKD